MSYRAKWQGKLETLFVVGYLLVMAVLIIMTTVVVGGGYWLINTLRKRTLHGRAKSL